MRKNFENACYFLFFVLESISALLFCFWIVLAIIHAVISKKNNNNLKLTAHYLNQHQHEVAALSRGVVYL